MFVKKGMKAVLVVNMSGTINVSRNPDFNKEDKMAYSYQGNGEIAAWGDNDKKTMNLRHQTGDQPDENGVLDIIVGMETSVQLVYDTPAVTPAQVNYLKKTAKA